MFNNMFFFQSGCAVLSINLCPSSVVSHGIINNSIKKKKSKNCLKNAIYKKGLPLWPT